MSMKMKSRFLIYLIAAITGIAGFYIFIKDPLAGVLAEELAPKNKVMSVGTKAGENGFRQITINVDGVTKTITDTRYTNADPVTDGQFVVWSGQIDYKWQIFMHDVGTGKTIQITNQGNNVSPTIEDGLVTWEKQVDGVWQIALFDGIKVTILTSGEEPKQKPLLNNGQIIYSKFPKKGEKWEVRKFDPDGKDDSLVDESEEPVTYYLHKGELIIEKWNASATKGNKATFVSAGENKEDPPVQEKFTEEDILNELNETPPEDTTNVEGSKKEEEKAPALIDEVIEDTKESTESSESK
jgi:hypothetical protein